MNYAIVLAGGKGTRMGSEIPKQFMELKGMPLICHSLMCFEKHEKIDGIILVTSPDYMDYVKESIVDKYQITKVKKIVAGGKERFDSVYQGLCAIEEEGIVFIHDGARPCVTSEIVDRCLEDACKYKACVCAMPVKDTIKVSDNNQMSEETLDRAKLWQIQTPQTFDISLVKNAYRKMYELEAFSGITDDAMVVEKFSDTKVKLTTGDYRNIKVTTPEDMDVAGVFLG